MIYETVKAGALEQATRRFSPAGSLTQRILFEFIPKYRRNYRTEHLRRSREKCMNRLNNGNSNHRDFIWYILKQQEKFALKQDEIIVNSALFIVAGSETTANLLSGLIARLIWNPDAYRKLCAEIRGAFTQESELTYENLSKLPYLNACLEEGLRIHPPVPTGLLRTVPAGGDTIDGHWVPAGTSVAVGSWAASHNPANFRDCDAFIPERYLDKAYDSDLKKAAQPFSLGPRGCIGRHLSYMEMRLILGRVLWALTRRVATGEVNGSLLVITSALGSQHALSHMIIAVCRLVSVVVLASRQLNRPAPELLATASPVRSRTVSPVQRLAVEPRTTDVVAVNKHQHGIGDLLDRYEDVVAEGRPRRGVEEVRLDRAGTDGIHARIDGFVLVVEGCDTTHQADDTVFACAVAGRDLASVEAADAGRHDEVLVLALG